MAEDRARARLHARRATADPRRADRGARCARGVRGVPALLRTHGRSNGRADLASFLNRPHGRPHHRAEGWRAGGGRHARAAAGAEWTLRRAVRHAGDWLPIGDAEPVVTVVTGQSPNASFHPNAPSGGRGGRGGRGNTERGKGGGDGVPTPPYARPPFARPPFARPPLARP